MGYVDEVLEVVKKKNADQPEFLQAVTEVLDSLRPVIQKECNLRENYRAGSSDHVPSSMGRRQWAGTGKQRIPCTV